MEKTTVGIGRSASSQSRLYSFALSTRSQVKSGNRPFESVPTWVWYGFMVEPEGPSSGHERVRVGRGKEVKARPRLNSLASWALRGEVNLPRAYSM